MMVVDRVHALEESMPDETPKLHRVEATVSVGLERLATQQSSTPMTIEWTVVRHEPLPDGHVIFTLVGQAASEFARLEHILDETIWKLADLIPHRGASITAQIMGAGPRCSTIKALLTQRNFPTETIQKVKLFEGALHDISENRNRLIHDPWYLQESTDTSSQFRAMPRRTLEFGYKPISEEDVQRDIAGIRNFIKQAETLRDLIFSQLPSS
jgi:hypothetical protein